MTDIAKFTRREKEIRACIAEGLSSKQIAAKLSISINTVHNHRKNILRKLLAKKVEILEFITVEKQMQ